MAKKSGYGRVPTRTKKVGTKKSTHIIKTKSDKLGGLYNNPSSQKGKGSKAEQQAKERRRVIALKRKKSANKNRLAGG